MRWYICLGITVCAAAAMAAAGVKIDKAEGLQRFQADHPDAALYRSGERITRVYGTTFGFGNSPEESAAGFVQSYATMLGVDARDLVPGNQFNNVLTQPVMYDPDTGDYKFTLVYYTQYKDGVPVYQADLRLLVLNTDGYPLVWAGNTLRAMDATPLSSRAATAGPADIGHAAALAAIPELVNFSPSEYVVWAGIDNDVVAPRLAVKFIADNGLVATPEYVTRLFLADAATGEILFDQDLIVDTAVTGSVHGMATTGYKADACNPEADTPMPYARVSIGSTVVYADVNGNFSIPNNGSSSVTVQSPMRGQRFRVYDQGGTLDDQSKSVTPPGPANFVHNSANTSELVRAEVNAYIQANKVRDFVLVQNPAYPTIYNQTEFPVNVNLNSTCNAYYDGSSINFYRSGGGCNNTAFASVVHHEYGHHVVACAGSGQGEYGEGMGDCMGVLIANDPVCAPGFQSCSSGIRNANNTLQYPCSGEIHYCGQLISGCVWSTRTQLLATNPSTYLQIISDLTVNSVLMHAGSSIEPDITIDFLTLDDTDGNIYNGTPHYTEICNGFGAHNMGCPTGLRISPTADMNCQGQPGGPFMPDSTTYVLTNIGISGINFQVTNSQPWVTLTNTSGYLGAGAQANVTVSLNANANSLPLGTYSDTVVFTNTTTGGSTTQNVNLRVGGPQKIYGWNFDTDPGWTTQGLWAWGTPTGGRGDLGGPDPTSGRTGSHVYGYNLNGGYTNNMNPQHLITSAINCSQLTEVSLRFWRWLGVDQTSQDAASIWVSTDGTLWFEVWLNPATVTDDQTWVYQTIDVSQHADNKPAVYFRWTMGGTNASGAYCGWNIDDVEIWGTAPCNAPAITTQPQSQTRCAGGSASFTVAASGTTPFGYQWRKNGSNISGATGSSYAINPVAAGDAGNYSCVITNSCGSGTSSAATLAVNSAPSISAQPQNQTACASGSASFSVTASGATSYQWRKNTGNIGGATGASYTINPVGTGDAGSYDCVVTNSCGSVTSNAATLTVNSAPSISAPPQDQTVCASGSASFSVTASGATSYQWRQNGGNIGGATSSSYTINPVDAGDAGSYDCVVTNSCGSVTSNAATLTVNSAPSISAQPQNQTACTSGSASFSVTASGATSYQWRKGGGNIDGATSSSYTINPVAAGDAGSYDCVVTNSCGSVTSTAATLTVNSVPSISTQPQNQTACASGSASFSVTASGATSYQWRKDGGNIGGATSSSYTINPVGTGDAGSYDCVVTNSCGSVTSNAATLTVNAGPSITGEPASQTTQVNRSVTFTVTADGTAPLSYQWRKGGGDIAGATASSYTLNPVALGDAGSYDCVVTNACGSTPSSAATLTVWQLGDMNCDGLINGQDIDGFVLALFDPAGYIAQYPSCDIFNADMNGDGLVNGQDIDLFVAVLFGG